VPRLEYIDNTGSKALVALGPSVNVSIGRNPGSTIQTANPSVSRNHAKITVQDGVWSVRDLGSSNGTFVNDNPVKESRLAPKDRVRCGDFVINYVDEDAPAVPAEKAKVQSPPPQRVSENVRSTVQGGSPSVAPPPQEPIRQADRTSMRPRDLGPPPSTVSPEVSRVQRPQSGQSGQGGQSSQGGHGGQSSQSVGRSDSDERHIRQIKEQGNEIETLGRNLSEHKAMVKDLDAKLSDWESRAKRYEVELDSVTEKYVQLKDQLTLSKERLEEAREEVEERNDKVFQLEARLAETEAEVTATRERITSNQEYVQSFKIKLTQKERQIEDLQRQYDLMEFEFRAAKEELQNLQEGYNSEAGDTAKLERKINQLREIIADKESVVSQLRLELENKDIEIRQIRMGVGISSLEDEKRKLLEDYYSKVREVDELRGKLEKSKIDKSELDQKLRELQADVEKKTQAVADIASHPDFKAKVRENARLEERLHEVEAELAGVNTKLGEFNPDEKKRLQGEVAFYKRKSATIEEKLQQGQQRVGELELLVERLSAQKTELEAAQAAASVALPIPTPTPTMAVPIQSGIAAIVKEDLGRELEAIFEMFDQWRGNFSMLKGFLKEVEVAVKANPSATDPAMADPIESVDSMKDLVSVIDSDAGALKSGLFRLQKQVGSA
jgi:pSer/pThr/pTyr-binding forkhead associated (FHA) protein/predicted  nucleic acid-binding Zn-ribbon protein